MSPAQESQHLFMMSLSAYPAWKAELDRICEAHAALIRSFQRARVTGPRQVNGDLTRALSDLYTVAVFIRGNFDGRLNDVRGNPNTNSLFYKVQAGFHNLERAANDLSQSLDRIKEQDIDLKQSRLAVLQNRVDTVQQTEQIESQGLEKQIATEEETIQTQRDTSQEARNRAEELEQKLEQDEEAQRAANIGLSIAIPIWGLAGLINKDWSPGHVVMGGDLAQAQQAFHDAESLLMQSQLHLQSLHEDQRQLESRKIALTNYLGQISSLDTDIKSMRGSIGALFDAVVQFNHRAVYMLTEMTDLAKQATLITGDAFFKTDYAMGILDICNIAITEPQAVLLVKGILDELVNGYKDMEIPAVVSGAMNSLKVRINLQMKK